MSETRRFFVKKALQATGGVLVAASLPIKSYAGGCKSDTASFEFARNNETGQLQINLPDWKLGDCELRQGVVTLFSNGSGIFSSQVCTHFTHHKDVWNLHLRIYSRSVPGSNNKPTYFYDGPTWAGPQMSEQDNPLFHSWQEKFLLGTRALKYGLAAEITSCC
jgi:hypothetical protein